MVSGFLHESQVDIECPKDYLLRTMIFFSFIWEKIEKKATRIVAERLNRDLINYHLRTRNNMENFKRVLKPGDVILVEGNKLISRVVMAVTHSTWSHSALYIGEGKMIDPLPATGTAISSVDVLQNLNIRVCRPVGPTDHQLKKVCDFTVSHVGRKYDHLNISNLLFSFFRKQRDHTEFLGDISSSSEVCSGLIAEAYDQIGFSVIEGMNFSQIVPGDFDLSSNFEIIKFNKIHAPDGDEHIKVWRETPETD